MKTRTFWTAMLLCLRFAAIDRLQCSERDYWPTVNWLYSSAASQGMDPAKLEQMNAYIRRSLSQASSVLVIRGGYIVFEKYYTGQPDDLRPVRSVTKSIISALIGAAIKDHLIKGVDQPILEFFPEFNRDSVDPSVKRLKIRHLLSMSATFIAKPDPDILEALFSQPLMEEPGTLFRYSDDTPIPLSMIIARTSSVRTAEYARERLFAPLGILRFRWEELQGVSKAYDGLYLTSRDMAKIGYLYLNGGNWAGNQVIPTDWVVQSTREQIKLGDTPDAKLESYGFLWWCRKISGYQAYYAYGVGGQCIMVLPSLDIVFVVTSSRFDIELPAVGLFEEFVAPSVLR